MEITGIITALIVGTLIGYGGRLVAPGKHRMSALLTILVGMVAALLGSGVATVLGVADTSGVDWIELILQVGLSGAGVTMISNSRARAAIGSH
jgi:uncharacterized membrane protein YeaQ/YmgE (transglycosylase-associated protein family)